MRTAEMKTRVSHGSASLVPGERVDREERAPPDTHQL